MCESLPSDLGARERREHVAAAAVADPALLAVEHPRAVGLLHRARSRCCRRPSPRWARSARSPASLRPVARSGRKRAFCSSVPNMRDALRGRSTGARPAPIGQRPVDLADRLEHARIAGLRQALAAVLLGRRRGPSARARRGRDRPGRRSSPSSSISRESMCSAAYSRNARIRPRTFSASSSPGIGYGKTSSSWISPSDQRLGEAGDVGSRSSLFERYVGANGQQERTQEDRSRRPRSPSAASGTGARGRRRRARRA